jgi:hypothetical protein
MNINQLTLNNLEELNKEIENIRKELKDMTLNQLRELRIKIDKNIKELEALEKKKVIVDFEKYDYAIKVLAIDPECERKNYDCFKGKKLNTYKEDVVEEDSIVMCANFNQRSSSSSNYYLYKVTEKENILLLKGTGKNLITFIYDCYNLFYNIEEDSIIDELQDND